MTGMKRLNPRRAYRIGPSGLRRIVLGESGSGDPSAMTAGGRTGTKMKPLRSEVAPVRWHMAVAHAYRGRLDDHAREALAAAAILASPEVGVLAVIFGAFHEDAAELGADRVAVVAELDASRFAPWREEAVLQALIEQYEPEHIIMPDNLSGDGDLGRRLIAKQKAMSATHVAEIAPAHVAVTLSGGSMLASAPIPRIILIEAGIVDPKLPFVGAGELIASPTIPAADENCQDLGLEPSEAEAIALEEADFIVSAGNGVSQVETLERLARSLGASVGASRVAVDDGRFPRSKQIGASGKTVNATTYMAVGISGAVQHLQGIKACRHVIAINRDPGAPIVKRADLTVIADAEELMQALIIRIVQAREQADVSEARI
jgi:electron transfer flavoprotein alpha subunit